LNYISNLIDEINNDDEIKINEDEVKNHKNISINEIPDNLPSYQVNSFQYFINL
jgi:hypothetical protein